MKYNILIMGGTTFVSSSLSKYLIKRGYEVDILTRGLNPVDYKGYREHHKCNRHSPELKRVLEKKEYDYIFDISAYTKDEVKLLTSSLNADNLKKYVFCSSGAIYKPCDRIIKEDFERGQNPNWGKYGLDKKEAEDYLLNLSEKYDFPVIIFRPTYIYGENNNLYREAYFFDMIRSKKVIPVPYGKNTKTQFIHIDDLVKVFESAMFNENVGKAYNVTYPDQISYDTFVKCCSEVVGTEANVKNIDVSQVDVETRAYFPFRDINYVLDISKLIKDGFYVPNINLVDGLKKAYEWYVAESPKLSDDRMNMIEEMIK